MRGFVVQTKSARRRRFAVKYYVLTKPDFCVGIDERSLGAIETRQVGHSLVPNDLRRTVFKDGEHEVTASGLILVSEAKDVRFQNLAIRKPGLNCRISVCVGGK